MAVTIQVRTGAQARGVRPVDPMRDLPAIVELVALGFEEELDPQGQKMLAEMRKAAQRRPWSAVMEGDVDTAGFVWVEEGRIVGNLSLRYALSAKSHGHLIGNVVVHPDYRGRGIGHALVEAAIDAARRQNSPWIGLEVREDNPAACTLYAHMGFETVGKQQHLLRPANMPWPAGEVPRGPWRTSKPRDSHLWIKLADAIYMPRQQWVLEVRPSQYTFGSFERRLNRWMDGEWEGAWLYGNQKEARLAVSVRTDKRSHFHLWDILAHPAEDAAGAHTCVAQALWATRRFPPWPVITFAADQSPLVQALFDMGFKHHRTLMQMVLEL
ncbi:MAG TPA: GNAT family N-acetyltransferase [Anaerolineae bacterium]|nr:GNAT family N-acetyltransferase [Anaerolineae bacterium]HQK15258.1 GNAT family N-acetyltransferase [Anaerolineae bacterium]